MRAFNRVEPCVTTRNAFLLEPTAIDWCFPPARTRKVRAMGSEEDAELMARYARGDMRAFELLYARHRSALYRYLARHARDPEVTNDLFQEVWSKVIANRSRYEPRAKFRTFLFRIAHNCFVDHYRRQSLRPKQDYPEGQDWEDALPAPAHDAPDSRAENAELMARYRKALSALPAEQRDVFLLYEESGLSLDEIGAITGVGMETAKSRLRYALSKLRAALTPPTASTESLSASATPIQEPGI